MYADYAVQITNYGPRLINGQKTIQQKTNKTNLTPNIGMMGVELGGVGHESSTAKEEIDAWSFRGSLGRPKNEDGLRTMHWELRENLLDDKQIHSQEYCTAFAFEHSSRPVYMRVEIVGTIRGIRGSARDKYERFSSLLGGKDNSTLTYMDFEYSQQPQKQLDDVVKGLDWAMQYENWKKAGVEMPGSQPARFFNPNRPHNEEEPTLTEALIEGAMEENDAVLEALARRIPNGRDAGYLAVENAPQRLLAIPRQSSAALERAATTSGRLGRTRDAMTDSRPPDLGSMVNKSSETSPPSSGRSSTTIVSSEPPTAEIHDDKLKEIVRVPAILFLIRFLLVVAKFFAKDERHSSKSRGIKTEWDGSAQLTAEQIKREEDESEVGSEGDEDELEEDDEEPEACSGGGEGAVERTADETVRALARLAASRSAFKRLGPSGSQHKGLASQKPARLPTPVLGAGG
jgi:hypothetical protein